MTLAARAGRERGHLASWLLGLLLMLVLVFVLLADFDWTLKLGAWVLITLLLDECGGWFGYTGASTGAVPFLTPWLAEHAPVSTVPEQWSVVFPLIFSGLVAMLLVKHSGGLLGLLLAVPVLLAPIYLARLAARELDPGLALPASAALYTWTLWPAVAGVGAALLRGLLVRFRSTD